MDEKDDCISQLKHSAIYQMSLGSKELYHSNVWAWLIRQNQRFAHAFGIEEFQRIQNVSREDGNRDISVYLDDAKNGPVIVIENKLKSIPNLGQLTKYQQSLGKRFEAGILTGIVRPPFAKENGDIEIPGLEKKWKFISYESISHSLRNLASEILKAEEENHNRVTILEYCDNLDAMGEIVSQYTEEDAVTPFWGEARRDLDELGLQDLINKVRASKFMLAFVEDITIQDVLHDESFHYAQGFNHKKNTMEFYYGTDGDDGIHVGVQIEANQFRRFLCLKGADSKGESPEKIFDDYQGDWFCNRENLGEGALVWPGLEGEGAKKTGLRDKYAKYGNDFVYQYEYLEGRDFEFGHLIERIRAHLAQAKVIFKKYTKEHVEQ